MVFLVAIVTQWTGFQFSLIASERYAGDTDRLTRLFGTFNLGMGIAAFIIQLAATGPALRRFGVGVTVLLLPVALLFGSVLTMAAPFFVAVVLTNAFDQGLRFSIDKATFELLYLPLPSHVKSGVKGAIDVLVSRVGDGVGGLLLGLATKGFAVGMIAIPGLGLGLRGLATCCAVGCAVWVGLALVLRRGYVVAITDSLHQYRLDVERAATASMDRSASAVLAKAFDAGDPEAILYVLRAFAQSGRRPPLDAVRALLTHETPAVRARALAALRAAPDLTIRAEAERLLHDPDIEVRTEALLWLAYHARVDPLAQIDALGDFADFSIRASMVALYSRPGRYENLEAARVLLGTMASERGPEGRRARIEAAMLLGRLSGDVGAELADLATLIADEDPEVASHAVAAAAKASRLDLVPAIATRLEDDAVRRAAHDALIAFGPPALAPLALLLDEPSVPLALRREIPDIVARIGTEAGSRLLVHHLLEADVTLRLRVIGALATLRARHPDLPLDLRRHRDGADGRGDGPLPLVPDPGIAGQPAAVDRSGGGRARDFDAPRDRAHLPADGDPLAALRRRERLRRRDGGRRRRPGQRARVPRRRAQAAGARSWCCRCSTRRCRGPSASGSPTRCSGRASSRTRTRCRRCCAARIRGCARAASTPSARSGCSSSPASSIASTSTAIRCCAKPCARRAPSWPARNRRRPSPPSPRRRTCRTSTRPGPGRPTRWASASAPRPVRPSPRID